MKDAENKWIDDTLESLQDARRAKAPSDLFDKSMQRTQQARARVVRISATQVWGAAACVIVLVVANLFLCLDYAHLGKKHQTNKEMFVSEYFNNSDGPQI